MYEDIESGYDYKVSLLSNINLFLENPIELNAEQVYSSFFTAYWIGGEQSNPFLELVKMVSSYEQTAGSLIKKHRDHYSHAVYVFLLGLVFFQNNRNIKSDFNGYISASDYKDAYTTTNEEFFYRWGLASLFHDVAYPLEITIKQLNEYYHFTSTYGIELPAKKFLNIQGFEDYKELYALPPSASYIEAFNLKYPNLTETTETQGCMLLARDLSKTFLLDEKSISSAVFEYDKNVSQGIVDHAYFGALICMKWHSALFKEQEWNPAYFYYPVLDSATSIFLHNSYKHLLMKKFNLGVLQYREKPIAYLLMFADLLQEWGRQEYGLESPDKCVFKDIDLLFGETGDTIKIKYRMNADSSKNIEKDLREVLSFEGVFTELTVEYEKENDHEQEKGMH